MLLQPFRDYQKEKRENGLPDIAVFDVMPFVRPESKWSLSRYSKVGAESTPSTPQAGLE